MSIDTLYKLFDTLNDDELKSILKSNKYTKIERHLINHGYLPQRSIKSLIPIIGAVAIGTIMYEIVKKELDKIK